MAGFHVHPVICFIHTKRFHEKIIVKTQKSKLCFCDFTTFFLQKSQQQQLRAYWEQRIHFTERGFFFNCKALILETVKKFGSNLITTTPNFIWFATKYKVCVLLLYFYRKVQGFLKIILNVFRCIWACTRKDRQSWVSLFFEISEFQISEFCVLSK